MQVFEWLLKIGKESAPTEMQAVVSSLSECTLAKIDIITTLLFPRLNVSV